MEIFFPSPASSDLCLLYSNVLGEVIPAMPWLLVGVVSVSMMLNVRVILPVLTTNARTHARDQPHHAV